MFILCETHSIHIFHDERPWPNFSQRPVVVLIEEVDLVLVVPPTTLAVALARIAADEQLRAREFLNFGDVAVLDRLLGPGDSFVKLAGGLAGIVRPDRSNSCFSQPEITAATAGKK